ncbi:MAG TPA: VacJ family lipoprotein [Burkholderiales bacterium]|jgi:phospholipid-binding lipoprotein MlaA|nr:VacJ family lipoprotein [Burkholderiales bacterium]
MALLCLLLASGCATVEGERDPRDPWEGFNRGVYRFNETFDEYVAQPVARAYVAVLHQEIRTRVGNFFSNIQDLLIGANNFLQGKFEDGVNDWARFAFNSTIGLLGIHDVASDFPGLEKHNEDFGQTLGRWGAGSGPYLILPFLGSSTVRDAAGTAVDWAVQPVGEVRPIALRNTLYGLYFVDTRAQLLDASRILEEAALDKYVFQRDAYLQRRRSLIYDGRPPREKIE